MRDKSEYNTSYILLISFISALGGYLFGFDFAVISGALPFLKTQFGLDAYWEGFTTASLALGCIVGCLCAGKLSERQGRKSALILAGGIFAVSSLAMAAANGLLFFIVARFTAGIGVGMASMLSPLYIAEVAPAPVRGRMVSIYQLAIVLGILITNIENYFLRDNGPFAWRWMFGLGVIPSILFCIGAFFLPESPRWLIKKGKMNKAKQVLATLGNLDVASKTFDAINESLEGLPKKKIRESFKKAFWYSFIDRNRIGNISTVLWNKCRV